MAKQLVNIGSAANDGTGDPLRDAFDKINDNFDEVYGNSFVIESRIANNAVTFEKISNNSIIIESEGISSNDNDTSLPTSAAVKDYVDSEISNLVAGAPDTLDTLDEIAAAIADNADFYNAVVLKTGSTMSGALTINNDLTVDTNTLYVDSANNRVGIGTLTPERIIHAKASVPAIRLEDSDVAGLYHEILGTATGEVQFKVDAGNVQAGSDLLFVLDGSEKVRFDSGGDISFRDSSNNQGFYWDASTARLGIGTGSAPSATLDVVGSAKIGPNRQAIFSESNGNDSAIILSSTGNMEFRGAETDYKQLFLKSGGNVGIGTDSPTNGKLQIDSATNQISIETGTAGDGRLHIGHFSNGTFIGTYGDDGGVADVIRFGTHSGDERMRITSGGDLLVGGHTAVIVDAKVSARSEDFSNRALELSTAYNGSSNKRMVEFYDGNNDSCGYDYINPSSNGLGRVTSSDYRLKEDEQDFDGLSIIKNTPVYDFKWKKSESRSYGVFAHELQENYPDAVFGEKDGQENQGVDYAKLIPVLMKAIQQQQTEIETLKSQINP